MKNILEEINEILKDKPTNIEKFKIEFIKEFNNKVLFDIILKKGITEGNLELRGNTIILIKAFESPKNTPEIHLCLSIPPFEKIALNTILETERVNITTIEHAFIALIKDSNKVIRICSPFLQLNGWTRLERYFIEFARKGGMIKIICRELEESTSRKNEILSIFHSMKLKGLDKNIEFREYHFTRSYIESSSHAKLFISDNIEAYIGSGEIRKNSFDLNFEMGVLIKGELVKDIVKVFDFMYNGSKAIKLKNEK
mgnify:CR=1 FL=1